MFSGEFPRKLATGSDESLNLAESVKVAPSLGMLKKNDDDPSVKKAKIPSHHKKRLVLVSCHDLLII